MTAKPAESRTTTPAVRADEKPAPAETPAVPDKADRKDPVECVVDDGTAHMGRAVPGTKICSAHAMRYKSDGTPRP